MDNRHTTFGLSRKNFGTWLSAALMLAGAAVRVVYYAAGGTGGIADQPGGAVSGWQVFLLAVLPCLGALFFAVRLIANGRDRLYKSSLSVMLVTAFFIARAFRFVGGSRAVWAAVLFTLLYAAALVVWDLTVNGARIRSKLPAAILFLLVNLSICAPLVEVARAARLIAMEGYSLIGTQLIACALFVASVSLEKITCEGFRPRRGDRPDGRLIRSLDPINGVAIYIMPNRNGASTYFRDSIECTRLEEYIRKKREEGLTGFGTMHVIAAAYVRVISQHPACNRFISGQKVFSRDGRLELAMVVKKDMTADAPETTIKVCFSPEDTADDVYRKMAEQISEAKAEGLDSSFDHLVGLINLIPGVVKKFVIWLIKTLDYFGKIPNFLMKFSPFHGSVFVTALGSLGIPPVYHHLYDFGNVPVFIAFGARRTEAVFGDDGAPVKKKFVDYTIVTDERICDGFYYASAFKSFRRYLNNPDKLDSPPEKVVKDIY